MFIYNCQGYIQRDSFFFCMFGWVFVMNVQYWVNHETANYNNSPIYLGCACDLLCSKEALGAKMKLKVITVM